MMSAPDLASYPAESSLHNTVDREAKARKILAIVHNAIGAELGEMRCAEVGCAAGLITRAIAPHVDCIVGLDYDPRHVRRMGRNDQPGLGLVRGDAHRLPFASESLDLVICAQVYEHVVDAHRMAGEIRRVLRPGGVCFFSGPNRLSPIEPHYGLPFVSWLPHPLADAYLRLAGYPMGYAEHPLTYWGLRKLWAGFRIQDYSVRMVTRPEAFGLELTGSIRLLRRLPLCVVRLLLPLFPNYNWILVKNEV